MRILGKAVSSKTEALIIELEKSFHYPVEYIPISARPNGRGNTAGSVDIYHQTGKYRVWLDTTLPQEPYEADILHELHHITQGELGYPNVFNKNSADYHSNDRPFVETLGSHLGSVVLDIDVNRWLSKNGYSYSFFTSNNYQTLFHSQQQFPLIDDPLNYAEVCLAIVHATLYVGDNKAKALFRHYSHFANAGETAFQLRKELLSYSYSTPQIAALPMGFLIDALNLWRWYFVTLSAIKIRTRKDYSTFRYNVFTNADQIVFIPIMLSRQPVRNYR